MRITVNKIPYHFVGEVGAGEWDMIFDKKHNSNR